jgi:hypothetical protein
MRSRGSMSSAELARVMSRGKTGLGMRTAGRPRPVRREPGQMNSWERAYAGRLEAQRLAGEIVSWLFEPVSFRLAHRTHYHPDFMVITQDEVQFHEVKAFAEDDARAKWKIAAEQHPWARWIWAQRKSAREPWKIEEYGHA